ncbi:MAG: hypothetical protein EZS28_018505 [Streblomastix strix]|uniref:Uncharacterized protein n=1 Tax=Streblomastix strix TaxID=222440 RepID=A0A5J4VTR3_9EUKA|nr:MAG: hypothetical protein EZS28_018505 [Streblomastix strix]
MEKITGASNVKSDAVDTVVLLGAGGTKPISEIAACLSDFSELYAYIQECYPMPLEQQPQPVLIGDQILKLQVKNNEDIIYGSCDGSNDALVPPVPKVIMKQDFGSQLERQGFLESSGSDSQLIVNGNKIILTASYATTCLFPSGAQTRTSKLQIKNYLKNPNLISMKYQQNMKNNWVHHNSHNIQQQIVCVFNLYFESNGLQRRTQEVDRVIDSVLLANGNKPQEPIPMESADVLI